MLGEKMHDYVMCALVAFCIVGFLSALGVTSADCRRDAIDSMCQTYGFATGPAIDVWHESSDGNIGFFVKCDNVIGESWKERFKYVVINGSKVIE